MLRLLMLLLILLNGAYFAWSSGALREYGFAPQQQTEPQRVAQQIKPDAVTVLTPDEFKQIEAQRQAELISKECWQAGPLSDVQWSALRPILDELLPADAWQQDKVQESARWIVYMGKYPNAQALAKKRAELSAMNLKSQPLTNSALEPGLSLGGFDTQEAASAELARLSVRGIRTARVVQEQEARQASMLKLPALTPALTSALKQRLLEAKPGLAGSTLKSCPPTAK